jgi:methionine-rich copper-binding protein CopC
MKTKDLTEARPAKPAWRLLPLLALALALVPAVVLAHARYDHSTPGQSEVVQTAPARVDIFTVQDMQKTQGTYAIKVQSADTATPGQQVDKGNTTIDDNDRKHFYVDLQPNLANGRYLVSFNNVSDEDGEADHGQFAFYVGTGPTSAQKALDSKLAITSQSDDSSGGSSSHTGLIAGISAGVVVLLLIAAGGFFYMRRRRSAG